MIATDAPTKFLDPNITLNGDPRARVRLTELKTLWFNTGTLCNLACENCYIESSPRNDRLVYITASEVESYLEEIQLQQWPTKQIGFTGGEPFMNPYFMEILDVTLTRGFHVQILTNAMRPMMKQQEALTRLNRQYPNKLSIRVSVDHYTQRIHEQERGKRSWKPMLVGLKWLQEQGFKVDIAARTRWQESEQNCREGFQALFIEHQLNLDAFDPSTLILFPEMDNSLDVPEISTKCWKILGKSPTDMMCASSRMIVKHKGNATPSVMACTLLPYSDKFNLGSTLSSAKKTLPLNHPHCSKFCVLGGGSCSG